MKTKIEDPRGFKRFRTSETEWKVAVLFFQTDAFGDETLWVDAEIRISCRPGEYWRDAFERIRGELPDEKFVGFELNW